MIKHVEGDILLSSAQAIAHGIAPHDDFKSGLARSLRESWPSLYKDFRHFCHESSPKSGTLWVWAGAGGPQIVNLFTQDAPEHAGAHPGVAHEEFVNRSLKELSEWIQKEKVTSLAITRLSTGVGKLDWDRVLPLIEKHLGRLSIPVFVYATYKSGVKAHEA